MKIIKLAQVPQGYIKVQIRIDKKGGFHRELVREGKSTCQAGDDQRYLEDLLNVEVPGFLGGFGEVADAGKTSEYWEQNRPQVVAPPITNRPEEEDVVTPQAPQRQLDQGYGV